MRERANIPPCCLRIRICLIENNTHLMLTVYTIKIYPYCLILKSRVYTTSPVYNSQMY